MIDAYAIKEISISPNRVLSIASALTSIRRAYEVIGMTGVQVLVRSGLGNDMATE